MSAGMNPFRADLNVMMASSVNIRGQMEQVDTDLGYIWEGRFADNTVLSDSALTVSTSPLIFLLSAFFALGTVLLSCAKPGRQAGRVSPVEASRYTEGSSVKKKRLGKRGAKVHQIAEQENCYKMMLLTGSKKSETLYFYEKAGYNRI